MRLPIKKYLPEILTGLAVGGVISSNLLWAYAAKQEMMDGDKKHYILPIITSGVTIGCIIASNRVSNSQKASLAAGAALMADNYYKQRQAIKEVCTPEQQAEIDELLMMAQEEYSNDMSFTEDKQLFYFPDLNIIWWGALDDINLAMSDLNHDLIHYGYAPLSTFLNRLGLLKIEHQLAGEKLIWRWNNDDWEAGVQQIEYRVYDKKLKNDQICHYITFDYPPMTDEMWQLEYGEEEL